MKCKAADKYKFKQLYNVCNYNHNSTTQIMNDKNIDSQSESFLL